MNLRGRGTGASKVTSLGRKDDLLAARASNRFALLLGKEQRLMGGVESKSAGRNEILRVRRRHRMREHQCAIEREFARQQSGAGAFDVDDIAVGENEAETLDSRCRCESDEAHRLLTPSRRWWR